MNHTFKLIEGYDERFRKYDITFHFLSPKEKIKAIYLGALANAFGLGTQNNPSVTAWNQACSRAFGAQIHVETRMYRKQIDCMLTLSGISDSLLGCTNFRKVKELFLEMLFSPLFLSKDAHITDNIMEQLNLMREQNIASLVDNPSDYALLKTSKVCYQNTLYALDCLGTQEDLKTLNLNDLKKTYHALLEKSTIIVCANGYYDKKELMLLLDELDQDYHLVSQPIASYNEYYALDSEDSGEYPLVKEQLPISQSVMSQIYRFTLEQTPKNIALFNVLTEYLTGQTDSVLFQVIREQMGICYRIQATSANDFTLDLNINVGLNKSKIKKALKQIDIELKAIKEGKINNSLFSFVVNNVIDTLKGQEDSMYQGCATGLTRLLRGFILPLEESIKLYQTLTPSDLTVFMQGYHLCSTYIVESD